MLLIQLRRALALPCGISEDFMADETNRDDRDAELDVNRETSRGGQEPPPEVQDRPEQNVGYDEAVKGAPLTPEEKARAEAESPLSE
jgi:hypothetical protein